MLFVYIMYISYYPGFLIALHSLCVNMFILPAPYVSKQDVSMASTKTSKRNLICTQIITEFFVWTVEKKYEKLTSAVKLPSVNEFWLGTLAKWSL